MSATRSWLEFRGRDFLPIVAFDVKYMNIIHPVNTIVTSKIDYFGVDQAASCRDTSRWLISTYGWFHPCESFGVQVKDIVKLTQLVWLSSKDINFLVKSYCWVLESSNRSYSLGSNGSTPFETIEIKDKEIVEPEFAVSSSENKHLVVYNAWCMKLPHWGLSSDDAWDIETQLINSLFEVNKNNVWENLEAIPTSVDDNLTAVPDLTRVAHPWLRQLVLINFWLRPCLLFYRYAFNALMLLTGIKDKYVVYDSLLTVTLSASEYDQVLAELGAWVAVPCWRWLTHGLAWINLYRNLRREALTYLDHVPGVFL